MKKDLELSETTDRRANKGMPARTPMRWVSPIPLLSLLALSGCATPALWKHTAQHTWRPQGSPQQVLIASTVGQQQVVVIFTQTAGKGENERCRLVAWDPQQPQDILAVGAKGLQRLTNRCDQVLSMPVYSKESLPTDACSTPPGYALVESSNTFSIHFDGMPAGPFELPVSHQNWRIYARVAGMPLALATDAAIIGAAALGGAGM